MAARTVTPPKKHKSGFCGIGSCEGMKPRSASGKPMKTCEFWESCGCSCHELVTMMFQMAEQPRITVDNPEWSTTKSPYWMPSVHDIVADRTARSDVGGTDAPPTLESPAPGTAPPVLARSYTATPTGRAARGELEDWVNRACSEWLVEKYTWPCTPLYLAAAIAKTQGIAPPSTGAITAAFKRWQELGFAKIGTKPTRFLEYTPEGIEYGLDAIKERFKQQRKRTRSTQARGMR